ncbi:MAG: putative repeat protein (TIGR01451 family) [Limisphaerales bacterium]|jgi:uncharacterized repeat protein (TIGR01451 family)
MLHRERCTFAFRTGAALVGLFLSLYAVAEKPGSEQFSIGLAKAVVSQTCGSESLALSLQFVVKNFGRGSLTQVRVTDDLASAFDGASFEVVSLTSPSLTVNPYFDGISDVGLLKGTDMLAPGETATIELVVNVVNVDRLGQYANTAFAEAAETNPDESYPGDNPDPNGDGKPNEASATLIKFKCSPQTAKLRVTKTASQCDYRDDGWFQTTFTVTADNLGDGDPANLQIEDDLSMTFGDTPYEVLSLISGDLDVNSQYNGDTHRELLAQGTVLAPRASAELRLDVRHNPLVLDQTFINTAVSNSSKSTSEKGVITNSNERSTVKFRCKTPDPEVEIVKSATPLLLEAGGYRTTFSLVVENSGATPLLGFQIYDDLRETFSNPEIAVALATLPEISGALTRVNPEFGTADTRLLTGDETLPIGATAQLSFDVVISPIAVVDRVVADRLAAGLVPFTNLALARGMSPDGRVAEDTDSADLMIPPPPPKPPGLLLTKDGQCSLIDVGTPAERHQIVYDFSLRNIGATVANELDLIDDLTGQFSGLDFVITSLSSPTLTTNPGFNGTGDTSLLALTNSLQPDASANVRLVIELPLLPSTRNFTNAATLNSLGVTSSANVDTACLVGPKGPPPSIMVTKSAVILTGDQRLPRDTADRQVRYSIIVSNDGGTELQEVQIDDDLRQTFPGSNLRFEVIEGPLITGDLTAHGENFGEDQMQLLSGTESLPIAGVAQISFTVALTPVDSETVGPFTNTALARGTSPLGEVVQDSASAVVKFPAEPPIGLIVGVAKNGTCELRDDGYFDATYTFTLQNYGDGPLEQLSLTDSLSTTFGALEYTQLELTDSTLDLNDDFDGVDVVELLAPGNTLNAGAVASLTARFILPPTATEMSFDNTARATAKETPIDDSVAGVDPDLDGNGIPDDASPTRITCESLPQISLTKTLEELETPRDGRLIRFSLTVTNTGNTPLSNVQITDDLRETFTDRAIDIEVVSPPVVSGDLTDPNEDYAAEQTTLLNGLQTLPLGGTADVVFDVFVSPDSIVSPGTYTSPAEAVGFWPSSRRVTDDQRPEIIFPVDSEKDIQITVTASKSRVRVGEEVYYYLTVTNLSALMVPDVYIKDEPPVGFRPDFEFVPELMRAGDDGIFGTPDDGPTVEIMPLYADTEDKLVNYAGTVNFAPVDFAPNEVVRIVYRNDVTTAAHLGPHPNLSTATCFEPNFVTVQDDTTVEVIADPIFDKATVLGKVFWDKDHDGEQTDGEPGIPDARLVTPEGLEIRTDKYGRFHIAAIDVHPIYGVNYVVKLDIESVGYSENQEGAVAYSDQRQIVPLLPGAIAKVEFAVGWPKLGNDEDLDCCGGYFSREILTLAGRKKKLDVALLSVTKDSAKNIKGQDHYLLHFELNSNYPEIADCLELGIFSSADPKKLLRNKMVIMERSNQHVTVGLINPPSDIEYQIYAYPTWSHANRIYPKKRTACESRLVESLVPLVRAPINAGNRDETPLQLASIPEEDTRFPKPATGLPLARDNIELPQILHNTFLRHYSRSNGTFSKASEFLRPGRQSRSTVAVLPDNPVWKASPYPHPKVSYRNEIWPTRVSTNPAKDIVNQQTLETSDYDQSVVQEGSDSASVHLERDPSYIIDHIDFSAQNKIAQSTCCDVKTSVQTFVNRENQSYSVKFRSHHYAPLHVCFLPDANNLQPVVDLADRCFADGEQQVVAAGAAIEYFQGTFDENGPYSNQGWQRLNIFVRPSLTNGRGGELIGFQIDRERAEESGHWRPPLTTQVCGPIASEPQITPDSNVSSLRISDTSPVTDIAKPNVSNTQDFGVAVIDISAGSYNFGGTLEQIARDSGYDDDYVAARLAGYWSGVKNMPRRRADTAYVVRPDLIHQLDWIVQLDTTKDEVSNLTDNLKRKDPSRLFRQLDPDNYYPTYGDDSTTLLRTDSQGAMFAEVKYADSSARWGNFHTDFTGTEFGHYNRSLYGAYGHFGSREETRNGDNTLNIKAFASEAQTAVSHAEFRATGGSLYYLSHTDVVMGSEKIWVEVRARNSLRIEERQVLVAGRDYEIDPLQGRILLRAPLNQVMRDRFNSVIRTEPSYGDEVYLLVDYEYVPADFSGDDLVYGLRGKGWIGEHVGIGATYVMDEQGLGDNTLAGADLMIRLGKESYISAEIAESNSDYDPNPNASLAPPPSSSLGASFDGGLTFAQPNGALIPRNSGRAVGVEAHVDFEDVKPLANKKVTGRASAWHKSREAGFNTQRFNTNNDITDIGLEVGMSFKERWRVKGRYNKLDEDHRQSSEVAEVQVARKFSCGAGESECWKIEGAVRYEDSSWLRNDPWALPTEKPENEKYVGVRVSKEFEGDLTAYASLQSGQSQEDHYADGELVAVGVNKRISDKLAVSVEQSYGSRGPALAAGIDYSPGPKSKFNVASGVGPGATTQFSSNYQLLEGHELFGTYTVDPDRTDGDRNLLTFGQRSDAGRKTRVFSESQFGHDDRQVSTGHAAGIEHSPNDEWVLSTMVQASEVRHQDNTFERSAYSVGTSYHGEKTKFTSRVELREDESRSLTSRQYVTSNALVWKFNESNRFLGKLNAALVDDNDSREDVGRFVELGLGYAHRPIEDNKFNFLSRYTYLHDVGTRGQSDAPGDERSHLVALEGIYDFGMVKTKPKPGEFFNVHNLSVAGKLAVRSGKERAIKGQGPWSESRLGMAALRATYKLRYKHKTNYCDNIATSNYPKRLACEEQPDPFFNNVELVAEYRVLKDYEGENSKRGALVGIYKQFDSRHGEPRVANTIRVGIGYNFSGFDDRLRHSSYRADGFFVDAMVAF